jgi:hypothetical protein
MAITALPEWAEVIKTESVFREAGDWERSSCNILEEPNNKKFTSLHDTPIEKYITQKGKNIQQRGFASGHPPNY